MKKFKVKRIPSAKLWGARFSKSLDQAAKDFSYSLRVDQELLGAEIEVSKAHALMLGRVGLITHQEAKRLVSGLERVLAELEASDLSHYAGRIEDIHTLVQNTLERKIGKTAKKLHTARSRNDLVATSTRIYVRTKISALVERVTELQSALVDCAEKNETILIPGYTHLQRAQVVLFAHHLLAYVEMLARDKTRLLSVSVHLNECPLGSCAIGGTSLAVDRVYVAKLLGFDRPTANSIDSVSDRDFVLEALSASAILMMHLSRFAEDLVLWNSSEFGFVTLADEFSTGSSLMPHKKNPDMMELVRGKTGEAYGNLLSILTIMKGLPLSYNRDMQEDKKPLFGSLRLSEGSLRVLTGAVRTLRVNRKACDLAVKDSFLYATDILEYLVKRKVPFRDAHDIVGKLVRHAMGSHLNLSGVMFETYKKLSDKFQKDVYDLFDPGQSVFNKVSLGGTNPGFVKRETMSWKHRLKDALKRKAKGKRHA